MGLLLYRLIDAVFTVLYWAIIVHIILSWIRTDNPIVKKIHAIVESMVQPIFTPLRKIIPVVDLGGVGLDLTPIVTLVLIRIVHWLVMPALGQLLL